MWQQVLTLFLILIAVQPGLQHDCDECTSELSIYAYTTLALASFHVAIIHALSSLPVTTRLEAIDNSLSNIITRTNEYIKDFRNFKRDEFMSLQEDVASLNTTLFQVSSKLFDQAKLLERILIHVTQNEPTPTKEKPHPCGGSGTWRRVAELDMTKPSETCLSGWMKKTSYPKRTCGRLSTGPLTCDAVTFPVVDGNYSKVCGRIKAYQYSAPDGFENYNSNLSTTIDGAYVTGVSVTHGLPRNHIWTFATGISEGNPEAPDVCPCDSSNTILTPDFVGNDYFCESGVNEAWDRSRHWGAFMGNDPLWDGQNCRPTSGCCTFGNPPYFVKELPSPSADDIEVRICCLDDSTDSDIPIEQLELYVQ